MIIFIDGCSGAMRLVETPSDAFDWYYGEQSAYLYTFDAKDFNVPMRWLGKVASDKLLFVMFIPDLKVAILKEVKRGNLDFLSFGQI